MALFGGFGVDQLVGGAGDNTLSGGVVGYQTVIMPMQFSRVTSL